MPLPATSETSQVPAYLQETYHWAYIEEGNVEKLDQNFAVRTLLFWNDQRLMRAYLDLIRPGQRVWQVAHVYGDLVQQAALRCGEAGCFHLTDVTPIQVARGKAKLHDLPWATVFLADARLFKGEAPYDLICSFFLLHEVPDAWKHAIVDNMLSQLAEHGELCFVDYHRPAWWQPLGYLFRCINRVLEPFAASLWQHEISSFASQADDFIWEKKTLFGGVYQMVRVRRRQSTAVSRLKAD